MKIMIDAGHGPGTPGKRSPNGMKEFEFNLAVANLLANELSNLRVTVYHSHSQTTDVPLKHRTDLANKLHVDCFISIHANAFGNGGWTIAEGIETYVYTSKPKDAWQLATAVQSELIQATGLKNRGVKTANFHVLRETKMTAILVECGFMTNRKEAALLRSGPFRAACAAAIAAGIRKFYQLQLKADSALYIVQAGAFDQKDKADQLVTDLQNKGFDAFAYKKVPGT